MDRYGCRGVVVTGLALVTVACVLQCFAGDSSMLSVVLLHLSYAINAIGGPVAMGTVSALSEAWFPPEQRTLATSIMAEANLFGGSSACHRLLV